MTPDHLVELGDTGWLLWREVLLRTTGFPVDGLELLSTPEAAKVVDAHLAGDDVDLAGALADAAAAGAQATSRLAADPLLREAVAWQNRGVLATFDRLVREGPGVRHNSERRQREEALARYWQRYCGKNETIGFFGPACWGVLDPAAAALVAEPGPGLVRDRTVYFEFWAVQAAAAAAAEADAAVRAAFPPRLRPHLTLDGHRVVGLAGMVIELSATEAAVTADCDGRRAAADVVAAALARPGSLLRTADDGYLLLERLVARGVLLWDANLPMNLDAERVLRERLPAGPAADRFERLSALRDDVAAAAGDADRLRAALAALDAGFVELTGQDAASRREGQAYAGRTLCHEETSRDLDLVLGPDVLEPLTAPLAALLHAARWLTVELAAAYGDGLRRLYDELAGPDGGPVPLSDVWFLAQGMVFGERPAADTVAAEFAARWARLFDLDRLGDGVRLVELTAAELADRVRQTFPAAAPGWAAGRLHSPDLHLCAADADAVRAGDFFWVLGELHTAWATFDCSALTAMHPDPRRLTEALVADVGDGRVFPLWPMDWPRYGGRVSNSLVSERDIQLGVVEAPGSDPGRLVPVTSVDVHDEDGQLVAVAPNGRRWPLVEVFSNLMSIHAVDTFKLVAARPHTPRIAVDRLVVSRESWRTDTDALRPLLTAKGLGNRFVEARRWRAAAGLPERVYARVASEIKPVYLDFTSPLLVSALCVTLRSAHARFGTTGVTFSEMLPTPEHAWVADAAGRRYLSELRVQVVDPVRAVVAS